MNTKILGIKGENAACEFLLRKGYLILDRNYRSKWGEIDIIVAKDEKLTFVEVKTRTSVRFGLPSEAVTKKKQGKIRKTVLVYLTESKKYYSIVGFDVIEIIVNEVLGKAKIRHIKNCF